MHTAAPGHPSPSGDPFPTHLPGCGPAQAATAATVWRIHRAAAEQEPGSQLMLFNSSPVAPQRPCPRRFPHYRRRGPGGACQKRYLRIVVVLNCPLLWFIVPPRSLARSLSARMSGDVTGISSVLELSLNVCNQCFHQLK